MYSHLRVASNPAEIGHAAKLIVGVHFEDILDGHGGTEKVATNGVHDTLGLASGAGSLYMHN